MNQYLTRIFQRIDENTEYVSISKQGDVWQAAIGVRYDDELHTLECSGQTGEEAVGKLFLTFTYSDISIIQCPDCGAFETGYHADSEEGREILICKGCGRIGEK